MTHSLRTRAEHKLSAFGYTLTSSGVYVLATVLLGMVAIVIGGAILGVYSLSGAFDALDAMLKSPPMVLAMSVCAIGVCAIFISQRAYWSAGLLGIFVAFGLYSALL